VGTGGDASTVAAASAGFPSSDLGWSARGGSGMFSEGVLGACSAGRGGTNSEGADDRVAGAEGAFAAGGPVTCAAEGTGSTPKAFGANVRVEVTRTGGGGDASTVAAALPGFPSSDLG